MTLPKTLKRLNLLLSETQEELNQHKKTFSETGKRFTARDRKSIDLKKRIVEIKGAIKAKKERMTKKKETKKEAKFSIKPKGKQKKIFDLIDMTMESPAEAPAEL
jgi:DNA replication protein DnaD